MVSTREIGRIVGKVLDPLRRRVQLMVSRAVVNVISEGGGLQTIQVSALADEVADDVERFQQYGFSSVPEAGAEAIVLSVGGNRDHLVAIVVDDRRVRFKTGTLAGDSAQYTGAGNRVHCKKLDGAIAIVPALSGLVNLGDDAASDFVALAAKVDAELAKIKTAFDTHVHGGVTTGPGSTGVPAAPIPALSPTPATKVKAT